MNPIENPAQNARVLRFADEDFPPELSRIPGAPERLFLAGSLAPGPRVALVGARRADAYGLELARRIGGDLGRAGIPVVSGGADGIDSAALRACLDAGGCPVAVLGTGLDQAYPKSNRGLFVRIAREGALLSEYPEGTVGFRANFPKRNRLVSGLAKVVVVVRAALRSGSLITARMALRQGRVLAAVPGPVDSELSHGCHGLLRSGAVLVEDSADVLRLLGRDTCLPRASLPVEPPADLDAEARRLLDALTADPQTVDQLAERCAMPSAKVVGLLLQLEFEGLAEHCPGTMYRRASS